MNIYYMTITQSGLGTPHYHQHTPDALALGRDRWERAAATGCDTILSPDGVEVATEPLLLGNGLDGKVWCYTLKATDHMIATYLAIPAGVSITESYLTDMIRKLCQLNPNESSLLAYEIIANDDKARIISLLTIVGNGMSVAIRPKTNAFMGYLSSIIGESLLMPA